MWQNTANVLTYNALSFIFFKPISLALMLLSCFTGLTFIDMYNLTKENLQTSFDGHLWIKTHRQKTGVESDIRLLDVPLRIIQKYEGMAEGDKLLPVPCYPNCKNGIKVIAKKCGIEKNVTWHLARHITLSYLLKTRGLQRLSA